MNWLCIDYLDNRLSLPPTACCYAIYLNGSLMYIGSTNNLRNRFCGHQFRYSYGKSFITPWGDFPIPLDFKIKYRPSKRYGDWLMVEARLIRRLQPEFNKKLKGRKA